MAASYNIYQSTDGWWVATIDQDDVTTTDGTAHLNENVTVDCPVLTGDANHAIAVNPAGEQQLIVGSDDYNIVVSNFNSDNMGYAQGSFYYDGQVDAGDYAVVLSNYGATLTAPPTTPGQLAISNDPNDPQTALDINWSAPTPPKGLTIFSYKIQRSSDGETFSDIQQISGGVDPDNIPAVLGVNSGHLTNSLISIDNPPPWPGPYAWNSSRLPITSSGSTPDI